MANCRILRVYRFLNATGAERLSSQHVCFCVFVDFKQLNAIEAASRPLLLLKSNTSQVAFFSNEKQGGTRKLDQAQRSGHFFHKVISLDSRLTQENNCKCSTAGNNNNH